MGTKAPDAVLNILCFSELSVSGVIFSKPAISDDQSAVN